MRLLTLSAGLLLAATFTQAQLARVQVIHNCADLAAAQVDVYLDNILLLDDFAFRSASPFIDAPAGTQFTVGIAPPTSTSALDAIYTEDFTLTTGETYIITASGTISPTGYMPATPFSLEVNAMSRETSNVAGNVDVLVFHGATDAPTVAVVETSVPAGTIVPMISYGEYSSPYLELGELDYILNVEAGGNVVATYSAPLATLGLADNAITVLASGFLDPSMNSNGPAFGLWVALPSGGPLVELPSIPTSVEENEDLGSLIAFPNPTTDQLWLELDLFNEGRTTVIVQDAVGRVVRNTDLGVLPTGVSRVNMDLTELQTGSYFMTLQNGTSNLTFTVQKQ